MKKTLLVLAVLCCATFCSHAQTNPPVKIDSTFQKDSIARTNLHVWLSIGLDVGAATGQTNKTYSSVDGVSFKFEFPFPGEKLAFTLTAAFSNYSTKSTAYADTMQNGHFVPIEIGLKYFLHKGIYFEGDIGESYNINSSFMGYRSDFVYSPMIGVSLPLKSPYTAIDLGIRYESRISSAGNINQVAFRAAYNFGL